MSSPESKPAQQKFGAKYKLIGKDYPTPDLYAKVTGKSKYAEDFRADGMLFCRLLLSPVPHGRVKHLDLSKALAMPGVKAILTQDDLPAPADSVTDLGRGDQGQPARRKSAHHGTDVPGRAHSGRGGGGRIDGRRGHRKN